MNAADVYARVRGFLDTLPDFDDPSIPDQADVAWRESPDAAQLQGGNAVTAGSHLAWSVTIGDTTYEPPDQSARCAAKRARTTTEVTFIYGNQYDDTVASLAGCLSAEAAVISVLYSTERSAGMRLEVGGPIERTPIVAEGLDRTAYWIVRIRATVDHNYTA